MRHTAQFWRETLEREEREEIERMEANGQTFDEIGDVRIRYADGAPTMLRNHPHLACRVALLGQPTRVARLGSARFCAEWDLPGRVESHTFGNPWAMDKRHVVAVEINAAAVDAVHDMLVRLRIAAAERVDVAEAALKALRRASDEVLDRNGKHPRPYYRKCGEEGCSYCDSDNA